MWINRLTKYKLVACKNFNINIGFKIFLVSSLQHFITYTFLVYLIKVLILQYSEGGNHNTSNMIKNLAPVIFLVIALSQVSKYATKIDKETP